MQPTRDIITLIPFLASVTFGLLAWAAVFVNYVWPRLRSLPLQAAARPLLHLHLFRYVGLAFIVPGVAGQHLAAHFAIPAAYGDLISMGLAWVALLMGGRKFSRFALWVFNLWGFADLMLAFYEGTSGTGITPGELGATWIIPTVFVPLLLCAHVAIFILLLRNPKKQ